jgi:REP element-mobilizing transposase RayT
VQGYDYTQGGAYFSTICTRDRECLLGKEVNGEVQLNEVGQLVESVWLQTATVRPGIELDAYVVMPNHFHAVFFIHESPDVAGATRRVAPKKKPFFHLWKNSPSRRPQVKVSGGCHGPIQVIGHQTP